MTKDNSEALATLLRRHYHKQMTGLPGRILMLWLVATFATGPAAPSTVSPTQDSVRHPPADSADLLDNARSAQRRFERIRRDHLPQTYASSGLCDLRIGRYCFTFGDDEPAWVPPPEHALVALERDRLIELLDSIAVALPADPWITMQRVRYVVEAHQVPRALDDLTDCMAEPRWLCDALRGYTLHLLERYVDADAAFARSLRHMRDEQRCTWEDLSEILDGDLRSRLRRLPCDERSDLQQAILALADPMYQIPGNELWTEHLSRHVVSLMHENASGVDGERWSRDDHRILMRYGWPTGWERQRNPPSSALRPPITTHYGKDGSKFFMPDEEFVTNFPNVGSDEWELDPKRPQSNHSPAYAEWAFETLAADLALFRNQDSVFIVASFVVEDDSIGVKDQLDVSLGLLSSLDQTPRLVRDQIQGPRGTLWGSAAPTPHLVSVEAIFPSARRAARFRGGVDLGRLHRFGLVASDLLLLEPFDHPPTTARDAARFLRPPAPFAPGDTVMIYWEIYGLDDRSEIRTTLSLRKTSKGFFRRVAELTPFADAETPLSLAWSDVVLPHDGRIARTLTVVLPARASDGWYLLSLLAETAQQRATLEKRLEIRNE